MERTLNAKSVLEFQKWLSDRGRSRLTARAYGTDLLTFLRMTNQKAVCLSDYEQSAMDYLNSRRDEAARSTVRRVSSFRAFARWAWEINVLDGYKSPEPAEPTPHPIAQGMAGIREMIAAALNPDQVALITLQGFFALRVSEARGVWAVHFDASEQQLYVRGKGAKDRHLDYAASNFSPLAQTFTRSLDDGGPLCRLSDSGARLAIKTIALRAGLSPDISSHDLRATCLTALYDGTGDIELVRRFAGHASVKQTQVYIGSRRAILREAVAFA